MSASKIGSQTKSLSKKRQSPNRKTIMHPKPAQDKSTKLLEMAEAVAHFGSWEWDLSQPRAIWSAEMFRIFGIKPRAEGVTLEEYKSLIHPDDLPETTKRITASLANPKLNQKDEYDYRIIRRDGSIRTIHSKRQIKELTPDGKLKIIVGVDQDVTEQKQTIQISVETIKLLELAEEVAHFGSWEFETSEPLANWSPGMFRIFGIQPRRLGFAWEEYLSFIHPDDRDAAAKNAQIMLSSPLNHRESFDYRIIRPDGSVRILNAQRQVREVDSQGKAKNVVGVDQDVSEQRRAEEALKKSEERFRVVAEAANVMVYEIDWVTENINFIRGVKQLVGYEPDEVGSTTAWTQSKMHPDDVQQVVATWNKVKDNPQLDRYSMEYRILHKNGNYIFVKDTAKAIKDSTGKTVLFIGGVRDITKRKHNREMLKQYSKHLEELVEERTKKLIDYERLAAIGQVAGMVGHDIRNPLQALISEVYLIQSDLQDLPPTPQKSDISESLENIEGNISYINKIVADLQDYSRRLDPDFHQVNLEDLIVDVFKTINVPKAITLSFKIKSPIKVQVDPTFTRRALTNLINNAVQAMPEGGNLEVSSYQKDGSICLTVADTGVGIPEEIKDRLFTPLFTTKSKGQGLGLAVVKRLVEAQGGTICFESTLNKGTKFVIKLPEKHESKENP